MEDSGAAYAGRLDCGGASFNRAATASYGPMKFAGRSTAPASIVSTFSDDCEPLVTVLRAVVPSTIVRIVCGCPLTVASTVSWIGFHSEVYRTSTRRATTSNGG